MAAKNKPRRASAPDSAVRDLDSIGLHYRASQHCEDLLEEARTLLAAGKIREARGVEKRAAQLQQLLGALEGEGQRPNPHTTQ